MQFPGKNTWDSQINPGIRRLKSWTIQDVRHQRNIPDSNFFTIMNAFRIKVLLILGILISVSQPARISAEPQSQEIQLRSSDKKITPGNRMSFYEDRTREKSIEKILDESDRFSPVPHESPNFGYSSSVFWLKFTLQNSEPVEQMRLLEIAYPLIDDLKLFVVENDHILDRRFTGRIYPAYIREVPHRFLIFHVSVPAGKKVTIYLRAESEGSINLPVHLWQTEAFANNDRETRFTFGLYYGMVLVLAIYNLFLFIGFRDRNYVYYSLTLLLLHGFLQFGVNGLPFEYMPAAPAWWSKGAIPLFLAAGIFFGLLFSRSFLNTQMNTPVIHKALNVLLVFSLIAIPLSLIIKYTHILLIIVAIGLIAIFTVWIAGLKSWKIHFRPARYYVIGWSLLLFGGLVYNLKAIGILASNPFTENSGQIGLAAEAIMLSLALTDRFHLLRYEKYRAQKRALEQEHLALEAQTDLVNHLRKLEGLKDEFMIIEEAGENLMSLLEKILGVLERLLGFEKGFIVVTDRLGKKHISKTGEFPAYMTAFINRSQLLYRRFNMPSDFFEHFAKVIRLSDSASIFGEKTELSEKFYHTTKSISTVLERLHRDGFTLLLPFTFRTEILGYMVLGKKRSGKDYSDAESSAIDTFRLSIAQAVRNCMLYEEISRLKGRAEDQVIKLSEYVIDRTKPVQHEIKEKTIVYSSQAMADVFDKTRRFASVNQPVLITGETGTGKELIARLVHHEQASDGHPFIAVNCAAIPENLWESEIFGYVRGAFTDAKSDYAGRVEQAGSGTLFFDEIGEMPLSIQPKMLRLLQERKFQRVGGDRLIEAGCRFIFATNRDLADMQIRGAFREDLFYRINVFQISVPPLRERKSDIPVLAGFFIDKYSRELNSKASGVSEDAMQALHKYSWPGNIRELENCLIQALVHCERENISLEDLPRYVIENQVYARAAKEQVISEDEIPPGKNFEELVEEYSRKLIQKTLEKTSGNKVEAAKLLGVKRATFYYKLKELDIQ